MNTHPKTSGLNLIIGGVYTYTNKHNYTTTLKVSRVTDSSIFVYRLLSDGNFSTTEFREGVTGFKKYNLNGKEN